jgi:peptidoglycan/LPS O-acetylase OafA/YrhL
VFWIGRATRNSTWRFAVLMLVLLGAVALAVEWRSRIVIALVTALAVAVIQHLDGLKPAAWPSVGEPLVRLGRISYSLFLIHFPVLLLVSAVVSHFLPDTPWIDLMGLLATVALSIAAAMLLYRWVESRPATWRAVLGLFAVLLACGAIVSLV